MAPSQAFVLLNKAVKQMLVVLNAQGIFKDAGTL